MSFSRLHSDIFGFVETGRLAAGSGGCEHAFVALRRTALGLKYGISNEATASKLFVSKEFTRTVHIPLGRPDDNFLRQVNWILWSTVTETALIIIPEEAEVLYPIIQDAKTPVTHLLTYAAPVTRKMLHFNNLMYYAVPPLPTGWKPPTWLKMELGIFAGRLYFEFDEYGALRKYLGFHDDDAKFSETSDSAARSTGTDGAADGAERAATPRQTQSLTAHPLTFLQEWLAVRRKGQDFTHTPMGHVCQGKLLAACHPFFMRLGNNSTSKSESVGVTNGQRGEESVGIRADDNVASDKEDYEDDGYLDDEGDD